MMGRTTLREIREALAAAQTGEGKSPPPPLATELESLARLLEYQANVTPAGPPTPGPTAEVPPVNRASQGTRVGTADQVE